MRVGDKHYRPDRKCHYCQRKMVAMREGMSKEDRYLSATIDHKIAKSLGGTNEDENYVICCARCNQIKGSVPYEVFKTFANMVLIPNPDLPYHSVRDLLNTYTMMLLESVALNGKAMRNACTITMFRMKEELDLLNKGRK